MTRGKMLYEGKAKKLFATEDENTVLFFYKDDATAFNGVKKGSIVGKGEMNNAISALLFDLLEKRGSRPISSKRSDRGSSSAAGPGLSPWRLSSVMWWQVVWPNVSGLRKGRL